MSDQQRFRATAITPGVKEISDAELELITLRTMGTVRHEAHDGVLHMVWRFGAASTAKAALEAALCAEEALLPLGYEASVITVRKTRPADDAEELKALKL